jgi:putative redox protein
MNVHVTTTWRRDLVFDVALPQGERQVLASVPAAERPGPGPSPMEALLGAVAGCSGMDVVGILGKMRKEITSLRMEVEGARAEEHPRVFTEIHLTYYMDGPAIDAASALRAVELSQDKYCSVAAMLRPTVKMGWTLVLNGETIAR